jgi:hypothetical protein
MEVAHPLLSAKFTPLLLRDGKMNIRTYLFFCQILDIDAFSEICILLHCLDVVVRKTVRQNVSHM